MRDRLIKRIVTVLADAWAPERIVLFGSSANPQGGPPGDIDILVVAATDLPRPLRRRLAEAPFAAFPVKVDVLVFTRKRCAPRRRIPSPPPHWSMERSFCAVDSRRVSAHAYLALVGDT